MTKKKKFLTYTAIIFAVLGIGGAIYAYCEYNRKSEVLTAKKPDFKITAVSLLNEFSTNEKESNVKYLDKLIQVEGIVKQVDKDEKGFYTIVLGENESLSSVRCSIDSTFSAQAAVIQTTSNISIKGLCTGYNADEMGLGADVILNRCVIITK